LFLQLIALVCMCVVCGLYEYHSGEGVRRKSKVLLIYFADGGRRGREKIIKKEDRNFIRKEGMGRKTGIIVFGS